MAGPPPLRIHVECLFSPLSPQILPDGAVAYLTSGVPLKMNKMKKI